MIAEDPRYVFLHAVHVPGSASSDMQLTIATWCIEMIGPYSRVGACFSELTADDGVGVWSAFSFDSTWRFRTYEDALRFALRWA